MRQRQIDKHARKMRDREINRDRHKDSPRHTFNPTPLDCLKRMRDAVYHKVSDSDRLAICSDILAYYNVVQDTELDIAELEMWVGAIVAHLTINIPRDVKHAIASERDVTANRFSPNRMRRHYHRIHSNDYGYHAGNPEYDRYERILSTWNKVYSQRWDGEPYHIDHLQPLCTARTPKEVRLLNNIDNLAMITQHDNLSKRGAFPHPIYYIIRSNL